MTVQERLRSNIEYYKKLATSFEVMCELLDGGVENLMKIQDRIDALGKDDASSPADTLWPMIMKSWNNNLIERINSIRELLKNGSESIKTMEFYAKNK